MILALLLLLQASAWAGDEAQECGQCHGAEAASQASTPMAQSQSDPPRSNKKWVWWAVGVAAVAGIIYAIASSSGGGSSGGSKGY